MNRKGNIQKRLVILSLVCMFIFAVIAPKAEEEKGKILNTSFPGLASGVLTYAYLSDLPENILFRTSDLQISLEDIEKEIGKAPENLKADLRKNSFFFLEQISADRLLEKLAMEKYKKQNDNSKEPEKEAALKSYFDLITVNAVVSDEEIKVFYDENKSLFGDAPREKVETYIKKQLLQQKMQTIIEEHVKNLGQNIRLEVNASWAPKQFDLSRDNLIDKVRWNGKTTLVLFGGKSCCGPDKMIPVLESIGRKFPDKINSVYMEAKENQILSARYNVNSIPIQIIFDKTGKEIYRHNGALTEEILMTKLKDIGAF